MPRRFDDMFVTPLDAPAKLVVAFQPNLVSRVLQTKAVRLSFMSVGEEIAVDHVVLFLVGFSPRDKLIIGPENVNVSFSDGGPVVGSTRLVVASFTFSTPQKSAYSRARQACETKYARESGTMYRSFEAFCLAQAAHRTARPFFQPAATRAPDNKAPDK